MIISLNKIKEDLSKAQADGKDIQSPLNYYLWHKVFENDTFAVSYLLKQGADPNERDNEEHQNTPLHIACENNNQDMARILIEYGANMEAVNDEGIRPFDKWNSPTCNYVKEEYMKSKNFSHNKHTGKHTMKNQVINAFDVDEDDETNYFEEALKQAEQDNMREEAQKNKDKLNKALNVDSEPTKKPKRKM